VVLEDPGAEGRAEAAGLRLVLDGHRHAVERRERPAPPEGAGGGARRLERRLAGQRDVGVESGIDPVDPGEERLHHLQGRRPAGSEAADQLDGRGESRILVGHVLLL
jgi:hypothetical protein